MGKKKQESPFTGRWRIISMDEWDVDYMEEEGPAFIEFGADQMGEFQFGLTSGNIDYRITERGEQPGVEWTCGMAESCCSGRRFQMGDAAVRFGEDRETARGDTLPARESAHVS